jgi:transketolase
VHGAPLGDAEILKLKAKFDLSDKKFDVLPAVSKHYNRHQTRGASMAKAWKGQYEKYCAQFPAQGAELSRRLKGELPADWASCLPTNTDADKGDATRKLSGKCLNAISSICPELMGGSADLTPSNITALKGIADFQKNSHAGRYLRFGVREHGMAAIANGISAYGGLIPFTATFLNFIQYCFPAVRLAALSSHKHLFVMTHDSIGLGEDGPTHQPVEAVAMCRATPNLLTFRPADQNETSAAYKMGMEFDGPTVICLSRQGMPVVPGSSIARACQGAYVAVGGIAKPQLTLVATGSEVGLAIAAAAALAPLRVQVVSMPCQELFDQQTVQYRRSVLPPGVPTVSVEALCSYGWQRYAHRSIAVDTFGVSAPIEQAMPHFGFTVPQVVKTVTDFLAEAKREVAAMDGVTCLGPLPTHFVAQAPPSHFATSKL